MHLWVEPAGGEQKSADVEQKMVTLIYPYPRYSSKLFNKIVPVAQKLAGENLKVVWAEFSTSS
jgi:hypothetical protein